MLRTLSTGKVAEAIGVHRLTLQRWLAEGRVRPSVAVPMEGRTLWRWTKADVDRARKYKARFYCKGRGRRKKRKG